MFLRVCEYPVVPLDYAEGVPVGWEKQMEQESARSLQLAMQYLQAIEKQFSEKGIAARSEVLEGKPAEAIVDCATRTPFNLIAMVTHGRSGLSRWAYGSVTAKIIAGTSSPLLLIRPK